MGGQVTRFKKLLLAVIIVAVSSSFTPLAALAVGNPSLQVNHVGRVGARDFTCTYKNASEIACGDFRDAIKVTYYYRTSLSQKAHHPVFSTASVDDIANAGKTYPAFDNDHYGYLHIYVGPSRIDNKLRLNGYNLTLNNSQTDDRAGTNVPNVDGDSTKNAPTGTCSYRVPKASLTPGKTDVFSTGNYNGACTDNSGPAPNIPGKVTLDTYPIYGINCGWQTAASIYCNKTKYSYDPSFEVSGYFVFRADADNDGDDYGFALISNKGRDTGTIKALLAGNDGKSAQIKSMLHNDGNDDYSRLEPPKNAAGIAYCGRGDNQHFKGCIIGWSGKSFNGSLENGNPATTPGSGGSGGDTDNCADASGAYAWLLCPAVDKANGFLKDIYTDVIEKLLFIKPLDTSPDNNIYSVWKAFVSLANVLFVLAFLGIIFGTVLNLDAYTVKKALPRLVIAAVAVQLSYFLCGILIDISNIFGNGLLDFIMNAAKNSTVPGHNATHNVISFGLLSLTGLFVGAAVLLGPSIALLIIGLVLAVLTFVVTLLIRKLLIITLIILAPFAIVAWVLPNTESLFKKWKTNFIKLLFIYPIMSILIGSAYVVQAASKGGDTVSQITGGIAPIIAFFMMPAVFKMSGAAMGLAGGAIGKLGKGANSKIQNSQKAKNMVADKKARGLEKANNSNSAFGRAIGRKQAGFGYIKPTSGVAAARMNSALSSLDKVADEAATRQLKEMDVSAGKDATATSPAVPAGEGLQFATQTIGSKTSSGQVVTKANQKAAVAKILATKNMAALEAVKTSLASTPEGRERYKQLTQDSFSEIRALSPDLVPGPGGGEAAYDNISAEHMLSLNADGRRKLLARMASPDGVAAQANATKAFATINASANLRGKLTGEHRAAFDPSGTIFP